MCLHHLTTFWQCYSNRDIDNVYSVDNSIFPPPHISDDLESNVEYDEIINVMR